MSLISKCWQFRELLTALARREIQSRYRGSLFGQLWLFLQPLAFLAIYMIVFVYYFKRTGGEKLFDNDFGFAMTMLAGLIPWLATAEIIQQGAGLVGKSKSLIKRYAFPTEILPVYMVGVSLFGMLLSLLVFTVLVAAFMGQFPMHAWLLPFLFLFHGLFLLGLTYLLSALCVFIKDIVQVLPMLTTAWFFLSPIFLFAKAPGGIGGEMAAKILSYNPMTYYIGAMRDIFIWREDQYSSLLHIKATDPSRYEAMQKTMALTMTEPGAAPWREVLVFGAIAVGLFSIGYVVFVRLKPQFADEI